MPSEVSLSHGARLGGEKERSRIRGSITNYRNDALPQNSVHASFQDRRGYLWFGTEEGAVRFDGSEWKAYRMVDGLAYNFVQAIAEDGDGRLWFGTRIGLSRFDPLRLRSVGWQSFTPADGLADLNVRSIITDARGNLWCGTRGGLSRLEPGGSAFKTFTSADSPACEDVNSVIADFEGRIWVGSGNHGVAALDPSTNRWTSYALPTDRVSCLGHDASGAIWIGTLGSGILRLDPSSGDVWTGSTVDGLAHDRVLAILCEDNGDVWLGTEGGGISCLRNSRSSDEATWLSLSVEDGLADFSVYSMLRDQSGGFWFGCLAGLTSFQPPGRHRGRPWHSYTRASGLAHDLIASIAQDSAGRFWFGTFGRGVSCLEIRENREVWSSYDATQGLGNDIVRAIAEDGEKRMWFGTFGGGLSRHDPATGAWRTFTTRDGLAGDGVRAIRPDHNGQFWVGTDGGGVSVFDPADDPPRFLNITRNDGLPSNRISGFLHDRRGRTWVTTYDGGVAVHEPDGSWATLSRQNGLPANDIYCIAEDPAGRVWLGTGGSGLLCFDAGRWRVRTQRDGLPNDVIYQILVESERSLYASTNRGVFRLLMDGGRDIILAFDRNDGLADDEANGGASLCDREGRFWFGMLGGASFILPGDVPERIAPCRVQVTDFAVHEQPMDLSDNPEIEDSHYEFLFHYGAIEYTSPHKVRYRTRLGGLDREWSRVTSERHIRYTNLRPGRYTFQVQARNWGGEWSEPAEMSFVVVPDPDRLAREEALERERIEKKVLEAAHWRLQQLAGELRDANEKLREKELLLELQAREDALTGLLNRRYLDVYLRQEFDRAVRFKRSLSVAMADLDQFKTVNDRFSHAVGDDVLRTVAHLMRTTIRSIDIVARYGGEEFVLILPETGGASAVAACEKVRKVIEDYPWRDIHPDLAITISIGVCDDLSAGSPSEVLRLADAKLFEAKRGGRNRVSQ